MFRRKTPLLFIVTLLLFVGAICAAVFCEDEFIHEITKRIEQEMITNGNYAEAKEKLTALLVGYPESARVYMDLGIAHYGLMEYEKAYEYLEKAKEIGPERTSEDLLRYIISKIDENRSVLRQIEKQKNVLLELNQSEQEGLKEVVAFGHYEVLKKILKDKYHYPAITTAHIIWIKTNTPDFPGIYHISGNVYYSAMFYRKAEKEYKKAIEIEPEDRRLYRSLADCLVAIGDFDNAEQYYDKSIELYEKEKPEHYEAIISRLKKIRQALPKKYKDIDGLMEDERYDAAEVLCKKRISLNPADYPAITQLGDIYWRKGNRRKAIKLFRTAIKFVPEYPIAHLLLGKAYIFENKPEKGIAEFNIFKEKMELLPKMDENTADFYVSALHYISYMYFTLKQYDKAAVECKRIIGLNGDDQNAHYNLAVCYYVHYRSRQRAYNELQKVIEIDPNTHIAAMAEFYIGYIRRNPDPRIVGDFTFIFDKE